MGGNLVASVGGGGVRDTETSGRPVRGRRTVSMAYSDGRRDENASAFAPIVVLSNDAYGGGVDCIRFQGG